MRVDRAVVAQLLEAVAPHAIEAALEAAERAVRTDQDVRHALQRQLEEATYEATLAARRHEAVDPNKRLVARELEARWEATLAQVRQIEERIAQLDTGAARTAPVDRAALLHLARDLHATWNAPSADASTKQRIMRILVHEVLLDLDEAANEVLVTIHWTGGRHTELRVPRVRARSYEEESRPGAVDVLLKIGDQFADRDLATTLNRMHCTGAPWTTERVRALRDRLGISPFDAGATHAEMISINEAARRLCIGPSSVRLLISDGLLPGIQAMPSAPWRIPAAALDSEAVRTGVREIAQRRPRNTANSQDSRTLRLPGV